MQAPSLPSQVETAAVPTPGGGIEPATSRLREQHCRSLLYMVAALWTGAAVMLAAAAAGAGALREVVAQVLVVVAAVLAVRHGTRTGDWGGALAIYVTYLLPVYAYEQMLVDKIGGPATWWLGSLVLLAFQLPHVGTACATLAAAASVVMVRAWFPMEDLSVHSVASWWAPFESGFAGVAATAIALAIIHRDHRSRWKLLGEADLTRSRAEAAIEARDRVLARIGHEIRTPLAGLIGASQLLRSPSLPATQRQRLAALQEQAIESMFTILDDLLDYARPEGRPLRHAEVPVVLRDAVAKPVHLYSYRAFEKGLEITWSADIRRTPRIALGDASRIAQILNNLVSNAVKFTRSGYVHISVDALRQDGAGRDAPLVVRFQVSDTGVGIAEQDQDRIFEPFVQVGTDIAARRAGSGLGLAICRDLAVGMGGSLSVRSTPGEGSVFTLLLPMRAVEAERALDESSTRARSVGKVAICYATSALNWHLRSLLADLGVAADDIVVLDPRDPSSPSLEGVTVALIDTRCMHAGGAAHARSLSLDLAERGVRPVFLTPIGHVGELDGEEVLYKPVQRGDLERVLTEAESIEGSHGGRFDGPAARGDVADEDIPRPEAEALPMLAGRRVLVCEDDAVTRIVVQAMIQRLGLRCSVAAHGSEGLATWFSAALLGDPYDVVMLDVEMPVMDGGQLARCIRSACESGLGREPLLVVMSGHDEHEVGQIEGPATVLRKPFGIEELGDLLRDRLTNTSGRPGAS